MDINYKIIDTQRIIDYITSFPKGVSVEEIIQNSGAEKLRVYPALLNWNRVDFGSTGEGRAWSTINRT